MISLDFLIGALLVVLAAPFLLFAVFLFKRLPVFIGIILLAKQVGTNTQVIVRSVLVFSLLLALVLAVAMAGSMMLAKGVLLWLS